MPNISVIVPHDLTLDPVVVKEKTGPLVLAQLQDLRVRDFQIEWTDLIAKFQFTSYGFLIQVTTDIQPTQIVVNVKVPWVAMIFKDRIRKEIAEGVVKALGQPAEQGSDTR